MTDVMNPGEATQESRLSPEDRTKWGIVPYGRQLIGLGLFLMAVALILKIAMNLSESFGTVSDPTVADNFSQFVASAPLLIFSTVLVVTLVPFTFGLTMVVAVAVIGIFIPFFRDRQQAKEMREQSRQRNFTEPHPHIPETGFELGVH